MNQLDRRALFTSGAAAALLAATGASAQGAPKQGGTLRLAVPRDPDVMDQVARWAVFDALLEIGPDGVLRGELATSWITDSAARIWTLDLRADARFHSGAPVTVADIVASLNRTPLSAQIQSAEATDSHTLRLELATGNPHLPYVLASVDHIVTPGGAGCADLAAADGSGCYQVTRTQSGRHFRAQRVSAHYKDNQSGWLDAVDIVVIPDASIRAEALRDGFVDAAAFPRAQVLQDRRDLVFHPSTQEVQFAVHRRVGLPRVIGKQAALDDGRLAERWWMI